MASDDTDKTEDPTPQRRRKAREEGQFPRAKDAGNIAGSVAAMLTLGLLRDDYLGALRNIATHCFGQPFDLVWGDARGLAVILGETLAVVTLPLAAAAALGATAWGLLEAGYQPMMSLAAPKLSRLDPLPKLKQLFLPQDALINVALQLLRVAVVVCVAVICIRDDFASLMKLSRTDLAGGTAAVGRAIVRLALWGSLALAVMAALEFIRARKKHEESIRMTRQEVKDEMKQQEGDPRVKQRQRAKARELMRRGVAQAVESSDFIIVNPTHVSVAIRYRVAEGAPLVTTKGYNELALHIRGLARKYDVPIVDNAPLARALARRVKEGRPIPIDLYGAVAEILAFVYRLKNRTLDSL